MDGARSVARPAKLAGGRDANLAGTHRAGQRLVGWNLSWADQESREIDVEVGDAHVYMVDVDAHPKWVFSDGKLLGTLPVTTGEEPKRTTRSGAKVVMEECDAKQTTRRGVNELAGGGHPHGPLHVVDGVAVGAVVGMPTVP